MNDLCEAIEKCTCAPKAVEFFSKMCEKAGISYIDASHTLSKLPSGKYYSNMFGNAFVCVGVPKVISADTGLKIISTHIDSPALCIKPQPDMKAGNVNRLNVEVYGGPVLYSWLDRPLCIAGRVAIRNKEGLYPKEKLVDFKRSILMIPSLAIHLNKEVNKGIEINRQKDIMPFISLEPEKDFCEILAEEIQENKSDILDYELYVYNIEKPVLTGINKEFLMAPRIDNISSSAAGMNAFLNAGCEKDFTVLVMYDNEEIGSKSKQGAMSNAISYILENIIISAGANDYKRLIMNGSLVSVDVAHAFHPNYPEKSDPTNRTHLGGGLVIKKACSQSYASDCRMSGYVKSICDRYDIKCQMFVNKSDIAGGTTLGSVSSVVLPMNTIDIGIPILAMHSSYETCAVKDYECLKKFLAEYYNN